MTRTRRWAGRVGVGLLAAALLTATPGWAAAQGNVDTEVALQVLDGRLVVPVEGPDGPLEFVLGTGSAVTVLTESFRHLQGEALRLGGHPVETAGSAVIPDASLTLGGRVFAGIVGPGTLSDFDILLDVPGGRLLLKPAGGPVSWEGFSLSDPVRLQVFHGVILGLEVEIEGQRYPGFLELGTPTLVVNDAVARETGFTGGTVRLDVGGARIPRARAVVENLPIMERFSPGGAGFVVVGTPLVMDCPVALSWFHAEVRTCAP